MKPTYMKAATSRQTSGSRLAITAVMLLVIMPLIVKAPLLLGYLDADPLLLYSGIAHVLVPGPFSHFTPYPTIDPNIGFTSHALGHRAALDVLSGKWPWWNHFEGVGAPLAGEMQSAALFPLGWLLYFKDGQLYMHLSLQIIAGLSTYCLLKRLGVGPVGAIPAALAFEFNGTFSWLANAVINPIAFLPLTLLGVEKAFDHASRGHGGGTFWLTIGLSAALYSGFPEVAYLNGLLILAWTLVRMSSIAPEMRFRFLIRICIAGLAALAIAAPILVAFIDYLPHSFVDSHGGEGFLHVHLASVYFISTFIPYIFGGIFGDPAHVSFWANVGGYASITLVTLAIYALFGDNNRRLRILLALWIFVTLGLSYGLPGLAALLHVIPGLKISAFYRYLPPSWEFSLCVLAAFSLHDMRTHIQTGRLALACAATFAMVVIAAMLMVRGGAYPHGRYALSATAFAAGIAALLAASLLPWLTGPRKIALISTLLVIESAAYFWLPTMSNPAKGVVDHNGVQFLQQNLGYQRYVTLGPISPNYGSFFGIAAINHNDLPIPERWTKYVSNHLDSNAPPILFTGSTRIDPNGPTPLDNLIKNLDYYRAVGTRYVLASGDVSAQIGAANKSALKQVYADDTMYIYELSGYRQYFTAPNCTLDIADRNDVQASCSKPGTLTRLELQMPGWHAHVDGHSTSITQVDELFQQVPLPQGTSQITFAFRPPYIAWAFALAVLGFVILVLSAISVRPATSRAGESARSFP